jgi:oligopeptide transport system substrate-binding protein
MRHNNVPKDSSCRSQGSLPIGEAPWPVLRFLQLFHSRCLSSGAKSVCCQYINRILAIESQDREENASLFSATQPLDWQAQSQYVPLPDANAELRRYRAGQLDVTQSVPPAALASIRKERPIELHVAPFLGIVYYAFNLHSAPFKNNANLRKALVMAVDRRAILSTIEPFDQNPAYGFVPKGTWNYEPQSWLWATWSGAARLAEARRLYAAAGYSKAIPLHLKLLLNANPNIKQLAVAVALMWRQSLGIETELIDEEYRVFLDSRKDISRWDIVRLAWTADYNDAGNFLDAFRSNSHNNDSGFHNARFDDLPEESATNADALKRREDLESADQIMLGDYPVIPIYFSSSKRLIKPYIHGELPNALNRLYSKHLSIDLARSAQ